MALQPDITKDAFDVLRTGAAGAQPVAGLGDQGLPHHRAGSTVVLKGSTMLAIGVVHHADSGPDDPNVDGPLLKSLAAQAIQHV